jgi:hypothetical protein
VFPHIPNHLPQALRDPGNLIAIGFGAGIIAGVTTFLLTRRKPSAAEIEYNRRESLARTGRITDGSITETQWLAPPTPESPLTTPTILVYRYRIAGVTYECAQDVSYVPHLVRHLRVDLPIQVRFDPRNPGNSILVSESWSGLRLDPRFAHEEPQEEPHEESQEESQQLSQPDSREPIHPETQHDAPPHLAASEPSPPESSSDHQDPPSQPDGEHTHV